MAELRDKLRNSPKFKNLEIDSDYACDPSGKQDDQHYNMDYQRLMWLSIKIFVVDEGINFARDREGASRCCFPVAREVDALPADNA